MAHMLQKNPTKTWHPDRFTNTLACFVIVFGLGVSTSFGQNVTTVKFDDTEALEDIPFDQSFLLEIDLDKELKPVLKANEIVQVESVTLMLRSGTSLDDLNETQTFRGPDMIKNEDWWAEGNKLYVGVAPLDAARYYRFEVQFEHKKTSMQTSNERKVNRGKIDKVFQNASAVECRSLEQILENLKKEGTDSEATDSVNSYLREGTRDSKSGRDILGIIPGVASEDQRELIKRILNLKDKDKENLYYLYTQRRLLLDYLGEPIQFDCMADLSLGIPPDSLIIITENNNKYIALTLRLTNYGPPTAKQIEIRYAGPAKIIEAKTPSAGQYSRDLQDDSGWVWRLDSLQRNDSERLQVRIPLEDTTNTYHTFYISGSMIGDNVGNDDPNYRNDDVRIEQVDESVRIEPREWQSAEEWVANSLYQLSDTSSVTFDPIFNAFYEELALLEVPTADSSDSKAQGRGYTYVAERFEVSQLGVSLTRLPFEAVEVARGQRPLGGEHTEAAILKEGYANIWDPTKLKEIIDNYTKTLTTLQHLYDLVREVESIDSLRARTGLGKKQFQELQSRIEEAIGAHQNMLDLHRTLQSNLEDRQQIITNLTNEEQLPLGKRRANITLTTLANFSDRAKWYISADLGFLHAPEIGEIQPYFGANFYIKPVNKQVPLPPQPWKKLRQRTAVMIGITTGSIAEEGRRDNVLPQRTFIFGVGYRVTDTVRLTVGRMLLLQDDDNPLNDDKQLAFTRFFSISVDWDVRTTLGGIFDTIFK